MPLVAPSRIFADVATGRNEFAGRGQMAGIAVDPPAAGAAAAAIRCGRIDLGCISN